MRYLFCRQSSTTSRSREHVIPESLDNHKRVLPPGVVCDGCNSYFSRKVERPLLESQQVHYLRFEQSVQSKRGRIPTAAGTVARTEVHVQRDLAGRWAGFILSPDPKHHAATAEPSPDVLGVP
ncbi:MAG: HNH endonuclease [Acidimicrobiales bacterium]